MNDNAKVFSLIEMREMMIDTSGYQMMEEVGEFTGTLEMKAQGHKKSIRIFSHPRRRKKNYHTDFLVADLPRILLYANWHEAPTFLFGK